MMKALIVEDEVLARLGLHQLIDWNQMGIELLEDAKTGKEAIRIIEEEKPDIVLLDLNIPEVNGLMVQRHIVERHLPCRTIVISCNEEFSSVKDVMRYGAFDYLRKLNLSAESLTDALQRCKDALLGGPSPENLSKQFSENSSSYESLFKPGRNSRIFQEPYKVTVSIVPQYSQMPFQEVLDGCRSFLERENVIFHTIVKGDQDLYVLLREGPEESFFSRFERNLADSLRTDVYIGVCEVPISNLQDLTAVLSRIASTRVLAYYDTLEKIIRVSESQSFCTSCPFDFAADCSHLKQALLHFSIGQVQQAIVVFFDHIRSHDRMAENLLKRMFIDLLSLFSATAQELHGTLEDVYIDGQNYHYQTVTQIHSIRMVEQWFLDFSLIFFNQFFINYKSAGSDILQKVFAYIDNNIHQPIQLTTTAKSIGISEAYLSSFFKREMGQNFITYVNSRKMELAKKMLLEGVPAYQVSESLGYDNYSYFSKVFKKYTNFTPDDFRKKK